MLIRLFRSGFLSLLTSSDKEETETDQAVSSRLPLAFYFKVKTETDQAVSSRLPLAFYVIDKENTETEKKNDRMHFYNTQEM